MHIGGEGYWTVVPDQHLEYDWPQGREAKQRGNSNDVGQSGPVKDDRCYIWRPRPCSTRRRLLQQDALVANRPELQ